MSRWEPVEVVVADQIHVDIQIALYRRRYRANQCKSRPLRREVDERVSEMIHVKAEYQRRSAKQRSCNVRCRYKS